MTNWGGGRTECCAANHQVAMLQGRGSCVCRIPTVEVLSFFNVGSKASCRGVGSNPQSRVAMLQSRGSWAE